MPTDWSVVTIDRMLLPVEDTTRDSSGKLVATRPQVLANRPRMHTRFHTFTDLLIAHRRTRWGLREPGHHHTPRTAAG